MGVRIFVSYYANPLSCNGADNQNSSVPTSEERYFTRKYILALKTETEKHNSRLIFFYIPDFESFQIYLQTHEISQEEKFLSQFLASNHILFGEGAEALSKSGIPVGQLYYVNEMHWKPEAHQFFGEFLASYLEEYINN